MSAWWREMCARKYYSPVLISFSPKENEEHFSRRNLGTGESGKYEKGSEHTSVHTAFAAATEEQWEPTPHTTHTSTKAGFCDGESAAYEAFCKKIRGVFWQSSGYQLYVNGNRPWRWCFLYTNGCIFWLSRFWGVSK